MGSRDRPNARGVEMGNANGAASLRRAGKGAAGLSAAASVNAVAFAADLVPVLSDTGQRRICRCGQLQQS